MSVIGPDGQFDGVKLRPFRIAAGLPKEDAQHNLRAVDDACRPAPKHSVAPLVAVLMARTKMRGQGDGEGRFAMETMVQDLAGYPLDVIEFACNYWIDGGRDAKWFPSWPELKEVCDRRMDGRLRLRRALVEEWKTRHMAAH